MQHSSAPADTSSKTVRVRVTVVVRDGVGLLLRRLSPPHVKPRSRVVVSPHPYVPKQETGLCVRQSLATHARVKVPP